VILSYKVNLPGFVEGILQVLPNTKNIVVILGASPLEKFWLAELRREVQRFTGRVSFTWFNDLSFEEMKKRAAALPDHPLLGNLWKRGKGRFLGGMRWELCGEFLRQDTSSLLG
jgi:hypothetical protein